MSSILTSSQKAAIDHFSAYARTRKADAKKTIENILKMCDIARTDYEEAVATLKTHAQVALHFHPDRPDSELRTVAEALLVDGIYKSQFETLISNGSVSAHPGGERDLWEKVLFGGAYNMEGALNSHRPKYGALDLMRHSDGPAPSFGSCYFLLKPEISKRCTFTYLDSHQDPKEKGTLAEFDDVIAALLTDIFYYDSALGEKEISVPDLMNKLFGLAKPCTHENAPKRNLNHYIEAQVHGGILLNRDVEKLVADPSFQRTATGAHITMIAKKYGLELHWHPGFALGVVDVPRDFRGSTMPSLAQRVAYNNKIDAACIGPAVFDLKRNPTSWADRGSPSEVLQELKLLWHVLVRYG